MKLLVNPEYANQSKMFTNLCSYKEKGLPVVPYDEIDSAKELPESYLVGEFDGNGRLVTLSSFVGGELLFIQKITYKGNALAEVTKLDKAGEITQRVVYAKGAASAMLE
jgi:hypothetical protein